MIFQRGFRTIKRQVMKNSRTLGDAKIQPGKTFERNNRTSSLGGSGLARKAYAVGDAGVGTTIQCYLDTDETGIEVEVNCSIVGGAGALNTASPRLEEGSLIFIASIDSEWYCVTVFQSTEDCVC